MPRTRLNGHDARIRVGGAAPKPMLHLSENYALLGIFFQMAGISLVALLSLFLTRLIDRPYLTGASPGPP